MSYSTDQLRKDNALGEYKLSEEEEEIKIIQAPSAPAPSHAENVHEPKQ